eukprot:2475360-Amphidinium_carterae.1
MQCANANIVEKLAFSPRMSDGSSEDLVVPSRPRSDIRPTRAKLAVAQESNAFRGSDPDCDCD